MGLIYIKVGQMDGSQNTSRWASQMGGRDKTSTSWWVNMYNTYILISPYTAAHDPENGWTTHLHIIVDGLTSQPIFR
jgi:hypothetical protein